MSVVDMMSFVLMILDRSSPKGSNFGDKETRMSREASTIDKFLWSSLDEEKRKEIRKGEKS